MSSCGLNFVPKSIFYDVFWISGLIKFFTTMEKTVVLESNLTVLKKGKYAKNKQ